MYLSKDGASLRLLQATGRAEGLDPKSVTEYGNKLMKEALIHTSAYRSARGRLMNENDYIEQSPIIDPVEQRIYDELKNCRSEFGVCTLTYQTLLRATSYVTKDSKTITREYANSTIPPPAFDHSMPSDYNSIANREMRRDILRWIKHTHEGFPQELKNEFKKMREWLEKKEPEWILLHNGTTTSLRAFGIDLNDIMGNVVCPRSFMDKFPAIAKFFRIKNAYLHGDGIVYYMYPESESVTGVGGVHKNIPDKDGKTREIYQMYPWVQVISKGVHRALDRVARNLHGNYTYNQREILHHIVDKGYNKRGSGYTFVGTDMSKYSDTLLRSFIIGIFSACGIPDDVCEELDMLYSLPIYDPIRNCIWDGSVATYQGQYGDFPMITIANIVLQEYMYFWSKIPHEEGLNGAVGDDTLTGAKGNHTDMYRHISRIYGSVGVKINNDKTSILCDGVGAIDFVKLQVTSEGILGFLNLRATKQGNWDKVIVDILESHLDQEQKNFILKAMFPGVDLDNLLSISRMNGGTSDHAINNRDLAMFSYKMLEYKSVQEPKKDLMHNFLSKLLAWLQEEELADLLDTPLLGFLDKDDLFTLSVIQNLDRNEYLIKKILNIVSLGYKGSKVTNLEYLIGAKPSELDEQLKEEDRMIHQGIITQYTTPRMVAWKSVQDYESWMAFREKSNYGKQTSRDRLLRLSEVDLSEQPIFTSYEYTNIVLNTLPVSEYGDLAVALKHKRNCEKIQQLIGNVGDIYTIDAFGHRYYYIEVHWYGKRGKYRLYDVDYNSLYNKIPMDFYEKHMRPRLRISYEEFYQHWKNWDANGEKYTRLLEKCGVK